MIPSASLDPAAVAQAKASDGPTAFLVACEDEYLGAYALHDPATPSFRDVLRDLVSRFDAPGPDGFGGKDLAVWGDGRLVACLRRTPDGRLKLTLFR